MSSEKQKSREAYKRATNPSLRRIDSSDDDEDTKKQKALEKAVHGFSIPRYRPNVVVHRNAENDITVTFNILL